MNTFDLDMQRDQFLNIFDTCIGEREGKEALREWLLSDHCDFFIAPASTKYHGNYDGGLCEHSIDVYEMAVRLESLYREDIRTDEDVFEAYKDECLAGLTEDALRAQIDAFAGNYASVKDQPALAACWNNYQNARAKAGKTE